VSRKILRYPPIEVIFTAIIMMITLLLSGLFHLPLLFPTPNGAAFVGVHYLLPLIGLLIFAACAAIWGKRDILRTVAIGLPCYAVVLLAHFNLKLWTPLINKANYDAAYWTTDLAVRPLVDLSFFVRRALEPIIPWHANAYMLGFIMLFYISFCYHAVRTPAVFRQLVMAALLFQGLGGLAYMLFPAVGPFIFEKGVNPVATETQNFMLETRAQLLSGGRTWLATAGSPNLVAGLGAMPSLHAGGAFLFLWFASRHGRVLLPTYVPVFIYILFTAVANRWHYVIDIPFGIALAALCIYFAGKVTPGARTEAARTEPLPCHPATAARATGQECPKLTYPAQAGRIALMVATLVALSAMIDAHVTAAPATRSTA
jgi:hypothetical protein